MMSLSLENDKICRTCLSGNDDMMCVFSTPEFEQTGTRVCDLILLCASVKIQEGDGLPEQVCTGCITELKKAFIFRKLCEKSDAVLRDKLNSTQNIEQHVKTEPQINLEAEPTNVINFIKLECVNDDYKVEVTDSETNQDVDPMENKLNYNDGIRNRIESDEVSCMLPNLEELANNATANFLSQKSAQIYEKQYQTFFVWCQKNNGKNFTENDFLTYFNEKAKNFKSSTLWSTYSMLKSTFLIKHNINISKYPKLLAFLKEQNTGYKPKKSNIFTRQDLNRFLLEAPDKNYLMWKVCLIFGMAGACRMEELKKMSLDDIEDKDNILIITIPKSRTRRRRTFTITSKMCDDLNPIDIYRKYLALRPPHTPHRALFVFYRLAKCSIQPIGIHTFGKIPSQIAAYLELPDPCTYTGHSFRRTSASLLADTSPRLLTLKQHDGLKRKDVAEGIVYNWETRILHGQSLYTPSTSAPTEFISTSAIKSETD